MSLFDSKTWYVFNSTNLPGTTLSAGIFQDSNGAINMTEYGSLSSENWQLFYQQGVYFIRNYDYGAKYQLGITTNSMSVPKLYARSGALGQQWNIVQTEGGYRLVNGLWGNGSWLSLPSGWLMPAMASEKGGEAWIIRRNPSADATGPKGDDMYSTVEGLAIQTISSSSIAGPPSTSLASVTSATVSSTFSLAPTATLSNTAAAKNSTLQAGPIAGIAIGGVALLIGFLFTVLFLVRRRRRRAKQNPYELQGDPSSRATEKYAYRAELAEPPSELAGPPLRYEKEAGVAAVELPER
ncbi:hypothetical protein ACN47E_006305 [Coniothyrium glycines]